MTDSSWPETVLASWKDFNDLVLENHIRLVKPHQRSYWYRGQSKSEWSLDSAFTRFCRKLSIDRDLAYSLEGRALEIFQNRAHLYLSPHLLPPGSNILSWWTLMQHYRAPTRVLDWTLSPLVALYFTVKENWDEDGALWSFHPTKLNILSDKQYGELPDFNEGPSGDFLFNPNPPPRIIAFGYNRSTDRMVAQQGTFSACVDPLLDHAEGIAGILPPNEVCDEGKSLLIFRNKFVVAAKAKPEFLRRLHHMNITVASLFPGIDGLGQEIEEIIRMS
ncbi:MAG: FRG domain-containing protein [Nitrospira sp.]|nr:FRG domain-containing protein [Nitrospira sp.]